MENNLNFLVSCKIGTWKYGITTPVPVPSHTHAPHTRSYEPRCPLLSRLQFATPVSDAKGADQHVSDQPWPRGNPKYVLQTDLSKFHKRRKLNRGSTGAGQTQSPFPKPSTQVDEAVDTSGDGLLRKAQQMPIE